MKRYNFILTTLTAFMLGYAPQVFATMSATITLVSATAKINQPMYANVLVSNTGASAVTVTGLIPYASFADLPANSLLLGTARNYGILAASAITSTGATVVTGSIGEYPGSTVTGFPPGTYTGVADTGNAAAQAAQASALAAYNTGRALSATSISAVLDNQTLTSGVYTETAGTFNLAASGNAQMTLSGTGTFIFQAASTLVTGAGGIPTINLTNGALASNVYWLVGSSATINSGSAGTFQGNIIAQASITDTLGGTVNGSLIALTGAVTLSAATTSNIQVPTTSSPSSGGRIPDAFSVFTGMGPNATPFVVPANGATYVPFTAVFFAPSTGVLGTGSGAYALTATVTTSDGSIFQPTPVLATVNPIPPGR